MIDTVIPIYKELYLTPLEALEALRKAKPELAEVKLTYAGRLDPMAAGVLLVLSGDYVKKKEAYTALPKTYTATIMFGFSTDTYDLLGLPSKAPVANIDQINLALTSLIGKHTQTYPPYSSKTVQGKPLWSWAKSGKLDSITLPTKDIEISQAQLIQQDSIAKSAVLTKVSQACNHVTGDFRQQEIRLAWQKVLQEHSEQLATCKVTITCSSGTYIRSVAHELGKKLGGGACLLHLLRTHVGPYSLEDCVL